MGCRSVNHSNRNALFMTKLTRGLLLFQRPYVPFIVIDCARNLQLLPNGILVQFDDDWRDIFNVPWEIVSETKLKYLQFKFIHQILPKNKLLFAMKKVKSAHYFL